MEATREAPAIQMVEKLQEVEKLLLTALAIIAHPPATIVDMAESGPTIISIKEKIAIKSATITPMVEAVKQHLTIPVAQATLMVEKLQEMND